MTRIFQNNLREIDVISRIGGDEFLLFLPNTGEEVRVLFKRIQTDILKNTKPSAKISAGILTCKATNISTEQLIKKADRLMYKAKKNGGNQAQYRKI